MEISFRDFCDPEVLAQVLETGFGKLNPGTGIGRFMCKLLESFLAEVLEAEEDDPAGLICFINSSLACSIFRLSALILSVSDCKSKGYHNQYLKYCKTCTLKNSEYKQCILPIILREESPLLSSLRSLERDRLFLSRDRDRDRHCGCGRAHNRDLDSDCDRARDCGRGFDRDI